MSMCAKAPIHSDESAAPIVYTHGSSALPRPPRNQKKPTIVISGPTRFSGRRHHA